MRTPTSLVLLFLLLATSTAVFAQNAQTYCNFEDGNQVTIQYNPTPKEEPRNGRVWAPGITLYVQTPLMLDSTEIPLGAYSVYLIPDRKNWTIIVNKNVTAGAAYNSAQDLAKAPMDVGELPEPTKQLQLSFAHMAAKQCNLRVYYQKAGAFVDFLEK
ncbi:MAG TPA: DUF2911 domain-containing protein [Terriglobales bacterium]|nr:DUF2911 domain-containing protein [Terriglobales bacterium]